MNHVFRYGSEWQVSPNANELFSFLTSPSFLTTISSFAMGGKTRPQIQLNSSSASLFTAGASGFLNLSQSGDRPDRYATPVS
jgi:hypothetical protein